MSTAADMAIIAALVGDPARAGMLTELLDGRALPAGELAQAAGVAPATASEHLAKLTGAGLLSVQPQGRHRHYRLASREVAAMLEAILVLAGPPGAARRATPRVPPALKAARTCYDHIAGELGVAIADALIARGAVVLGADLGEVTAVGERLLGAWGVAPAPGRSRRLYCRACLDWSERRPHLAGEVGALILARSLELGWLARAPKGRGLTISEHGRSGYRRLFGIGG